MDYSTLVKRLYSLFQEQQIKGLATDHRLVKENEVFFALKCKNHDGKDYITEALSRKAAFVVTSDKLINQMLDVDKIIYVADVQAALNSSIQTFYSQEPKVRIAVTGTNGKSSVVSYIAQLYSFLGKRSACVGTLGVQTFVQNNDFKCTESTSGLTTPDFLGLKKIAHNLAENRIEYVAFEASSHGLDQKRLGQIKVQVACFTSFSRDHLDYHKNKEAYLLAKLKLFTHHLLPTAIVILNSDMPDIHFIKRYLDEHCIKFLTVGMDGNLKITRVSGSLKGQTIHFIFDSHKYEFHTQVVGSFQAYNLLIAAFSIFHTGISFQEIFSSLPNVKAVKGRMQQIEHNIFVDYAHTPDALKKVLTELKNVKLPDGELIVIFGCGGDRDREKRALMGEIAAELADNIIVTDDNPRYEDPKIIRAAVISGISKSKYIEISDREKAIKHGVDSLKQNDILLIAGKGHEDYQIIGDTKIEFDDATVAKNYTRVIWNSEILGAALGIRAPSPLSCNEVQFNSKDVKKGDIFIALKGNIDGHDYVNDAIKNGANVVIVSKHIKTIEQDKIILVEDCFEALKKMAKYKRQHSQATFIAITGSVGKTSTKEALKILLTGNLVFASRGNFNNKLGMLINLASMPVHVEFAIFEIGMNHKNELRELSKVIKPSIAIITNIAEAHLEFFNSLDEIAEAKCEIFENLEKDGYAIINADTKCYDKVLLILKNLSIDKIFSFGTLASNSALAKLIFYENQGETVRLQYDINNNLIDVKVPFVPKHFAKNYAAVLLTIYLLKKDLQAASRYLSNIPLTRGRGEMIRVQNCWVICDYYNANPESMKAALEYLKEISGYENKTAIIGEMLELGQNSEQLHKQLVPYIVNADCSKVYLVGPNTKHIWKLLPSEITKIYFENVNELIRRTDNIFKNYELILIKGSRTMHLEKIIETYINM